ncbi:MAG: APC family permease [Candidatus Angelobacter sp.]
MKVIEEAAEPAPQKSILDILFGRPLSSEEDTAERIGPVAGVPVFGLDALSSAAYGPEAALTILIPLGLIGLAYILPISLIIIVLLSIVYFSYRQTIAAYPTGGGSYTVATQNLGEHAGLLAGAALMIDYILNVAVGISAGVGALVSALPRLQPYMLSLCLALLLLLTLVNLRGLRETGLVFIAPTYLFVACLGGVILFGVVKTLLHGGHAAPIVPPPPLPSAVAAVSLWILIKAFASGCTAMTGVEAVSNGVQAFREPRVKSAQTALTIIIAILVLLLAGIAYLCRAYGIGATPPGQPGYQSVLSQLTAAVAGRNTVYFIVIGAILAVLSLSANTSFAGFPRLCRTIAENGYLPNVFTIRGRRLVFTFGVCSLAIFAGLLLIAFKGVTDRLIPLFAVGAFTAFTLSQAGMVMHWKRSGGPGARASMFINGLGAFSTGVTLCIIILAKFSEGAWITVIAIPGLIMLMTSDLKHNDRIESENSLREPANLKDITRPIVVLPLQRWSRVAEQALRFAYTLSRDLRVLHIQGEGQPNQQAADALINSWDQYVEKPALQAGYTPPELVVLHSPYRFVLTPIFEYILEVERKYPDRHVAVLVPELIERHWFYHLLHNQRANALKLMLYLKGNRRIIVINVPWYVR